MSPEKLMLLLVSAAGIYWPDPIGATEVPMPNGQRRRQLKILQRRPTNLIESTEVSDIPLTTMTAAAAAVYIINEWCWYDRLWAINCVELLQGPGGRGPRNWILERVLEQHKSSSTKQVWNMLIRLAGLIIRDEMSAQKWAASLNRFRDMERNLINGSNHNHQATLVFQPISVHQQP
jgi:hypothetical protein